MRMVEERGKGGLYTPRSLIRKLKVYTRIDKKRNYKTRRRFFCEATTPRAGEIFLPGNKLIFSTQPILSGIEPLGKNLGIQIFVVVLTRSRPLVSASRPARLCHSAPAGSIHAAAQRFPK